MLPAKEGLTGAIFALSVVCAVAAGRGRCPWGAVRASCGYKRNPNFSAGRARKRKSAFGSGTELQEAALRLLDHHQNLNDLLLEVGVGGSGCNGQAGDRRRSQLEVGSNRVLPRATVE